ncbi:MAG: HPt (histidine-containing phosphotransfer) domain-containing protein [Gammaproteobacteria bacterium]|jgi:HPt (histidine-containing phosphotransfer) domain-containing protein
MILSLPTDELDEQALMELREDLGDAFPGLVTQFLATADAAFDEIDSLLERGDGAGAAAKAHLIRGTAGYLGALTLVQALDALQQDAPRAEAIDASRRHADDARAALTRLRHYLSPQG